MRVLLRATGPVVHGMSKPRTKMEEATFHTTDLISAFQLSEWRLAANCGNLHAGEKRTDKNPSLRSASFESLRSPEPVCPALPGKENHGIWRLS